MKYSRSEDVLQGLFLQDNDATVFVANGVRLPASLLGANLNGMLLGKRITQRFCIQNSSDCVDEIFTRMASGKWRNSDTGNEYSIDQEDLHFHRAAPFGKVPVNIRSVLMEVDFGVRGIYQFRFEGKHETCIRSNRKERASWSITVLTDIKRMTNPELGEKIPYLEPISVNKFFLQ